MLTEGAGDSDATVEGGVKNEYEDNLCIAGESHNSCDSAMENGSDGLNSESDMSFEISFESVYGDDNSDDDFGSSDLNYVCDDHVDSDENIKDMETENGQVIVISDDEENEDRTLAVPDITRVIQTFTLTMRRTTTYSQGNMIDVKTEYLWEGCQTSTRV